MMTKAKMIMNVDSKPSYKRIPKDAIVKVVSDIPSHNYVMVEYQGGYYPVPRTSCVEV